MGVQSRELGWMMRQVFGRAERVIVNSRNTSRLMEDWVPAEKVTVLHPGVDTERFRAGCSRCGGAAGTGLGGAARHPDGRPAAKRKGHDMLIRALPRIREAVPDVLYAIVGDGEQRAGAGATCTARWEWRIRCSLRENWKMRGWFGRISSATCSLCPTAK